MQCLLSSGRGAPFVETCRENCNLRRDPTSIPYSRIFTGVQLLRNAVVGEENVSSGGVQRIVRHFIKEGFATVEGNVEKDVFLC